MKIRQITKSIFEYPCSDIFFPRAFHPTANTYLHNYNQLISIKLFSIIKSKDDKCNSCVQISL